MWSPPTQLLLCKIIISPRNDFVKGQTSAATKEGNISYVKWRKMNEKNRIGLDESGFATRNNHHRNRIGLDESGIASTV